MIQFFKNIGNFISELVSNIRDAVSTISKFGGMISESIGSSVTFASRLPGVGIFIVLVLTVFTVVLAVNMVRDFL